MPVIKSTNTIKGTYGAGFRVSGAPVNGTTGKGIEKGGTLIRTDTGVEYINTGTAASPTWVVKGTQS